jgi:antitoxin component of MazEF toxin-antitoxin module
MRTTVTGSLVLDPEILEQAGIRQGDEVEVSADGNVITVAPADHAQRDAEFRASAEKITAKYAGLFERLSK